MQAKELTRQVGSLAARAREGLLGMWRSSHHDFWRDSREMARESGKSHPYFPTATFLALSALHESTALPDHSPPQQPDALAAPYSPLDALISIVENSSDDLITQSAILASSSPTGAPGVWNPYTAATLIRALSALHQDLSWRVASHELDDVRAKQALQKVQAIVAAQAAKLHSSLDSSTGIVALTQKALGADPVVHPCFTYYAVDALHRAERARLLKEALAPKLREKIVEAAEKEAYRMLGFQAVGTWAPSAMISLANYIGILSILGDDTRRPLLDHALKVVFASYASGDAWPLTRLHLHPPGARGVHVCSFDVAATLAEAVNNLLHHSPERRAKLVPALDGFRALLASVRNSHVEIVVEDHRVRGWGEEHVGGTDAVETWVTALCLRFLTYYAQLLQSHAQFDVLARYSVRRPRMPPGQKWDDFVASPSTQDVARYMDDVFVAPLKDALPEHRPRLLSGDYRRSSLILFGPPGTAKTTLAHALAERVGWPLLTITPAVFLAEGESAIDRCASTVFADLAQLEGVVVLFDECDELFAKRPEVASEGTRDQGGRAMLSSAALITGAMLPRLARLHDRGRLIFVLATNRLRAIDPAVRRPGRFDHIVAVGPPSQTGRAAILRKHCKALRNEAAANAMASLTDCFTFGELRQLASALDLTEDGRELSAAEAAGLFDWVKTEFPREGLVIGVSDAKWFVEDQANHCHALKMQRLRERKRAKVAVLPTGGGHA